MIGVAVGSPDISAGYEGLSATTRITIAASQTITFIVTGLGTDGTSGGVLPNLTVQLTVADGTMLSNVTDGTGLFSFSGIRGGMVTLTVSTVDYVTVSKQVLVSADVRVGIVLPRVPVVFVTDTFSGSSLGLPEGGLHNSWGPPIVIRHAGPVDITADVPLRPILYAIA